MMSGLTDTQQDELIQHVIEIKGQTTAVELSKKFCTSPYQIRTTLKKHGITLHGTQHNNAIPEEQHVVVLDALADGMTRAEVAQMFQTTVNAVRAVQNKSGFRKRSPVRRETKNPLDGYEDQIRIKFERGESFTTMMLSLKTTKTFLQKKLLDLGLSLAERRGGKSITRNELETCIADRLTVKETARRLKTTPARIQRYRKKFELSFKYENKFSNDDLSRLKKMYDDGLPVTYISKELNSTPSCVTRAAKKIGLRFKERDRRRVVDPLHISKHNKFIELFNAGETKTALAQRLNVTTRCIEKTLIDLGLSFKERDLQLAQQGAVKIIESHSHLKVTDISQYKTIYGLDIHVSCSKCGHNWVDCYNTLRNGFCRGCSVRSKPEQEIAQFVEDSTGFNILRNVRNVIPPLELDVYIPEINVAIEFNGIYWHSEKANTPNDYHEIKLRRCLEKGIMLMQFFEDEWWNKRNIVQSMITHRLGLSSRRIGARSCDLVSVSSCQRKDFFERNHIDGDVPATHAWGLKIDGEFVSMLSVRTPKIKKHSASLEIARFASALGTIVPGALGRFLKQVKLFARGRNIKRIITYVDLRHGTGRGYEHVGFELKYLTPPRFWWTDFKCRYDRFKYKADKTRGLTQAQVAAAAGVHRIFGCSNALYELHLDS